MEIVFCFALPVILIIALIMLRERRAAAERATAAAGRAYQAALEALKAEPASPTLREAALTAGRYYSALTRKNKAVTVFDEVALKNDLDAATAGALAGPVAAPPLAASVADRLRQLDEVRQQGLVTEDEYQARRSKILGDM